MKKVGGVSPFFKINRKQRTPKFTVETSHYGCISNLYLYSESEVLGGQVIKSIMRVINEIQKLSSLFFRNIDPSNVNFKIGKLFL